MKEPTPAEKSQDEMDTFAIGDIIRLRDVVAEQAATIERLEAALIRLRDCDFVITPRDRMDAVRDIARAALDAPFARD